MDETILAGITCPADLKALDADDLVRLASEMREAIKLRVRAMGGHLGSNLGVVEATIALHRVFDSPRDKIVFDTSHQCYAHKMICGRAVGFTDPARMPDVSGFTDPAESEHDLFRCGHTSTSVSLACGLARARDLRGGTENVVALIGDGSLSGGEAFEGLDNAALVGTNLIIVVNDNEMSIAEDRGGIYQGLAELRATRGASPNNYFRALGLDYRYVEDGNSIPALVEAFEAVRGIDHPVVVHIHTVKGMGDAWAMAHKEASHDVRPEGAGSPRDDYRAFTRERLLALAEVDPRVVVVNAGAPGGSGVTPEFRAALGGQYFDVGICEQHAVSFCAGLAKGGAKPVFLVASTFLQRAYDQIVQDLALNASDVTVLVFQAGYTGIDATHVGVFDLAYTGNVPDLTCLSPATVEQYLAMIDWSVEESGRPVVIRVPEQVYHGPAVTFGAADVGRFVVTHEGGRVALVGLGAMGELVGAVAARLREVCDVDATTIEATTYSALDRRLLFSLEGSHELVVTFENGVLYGGFGEKVARVLGPTGLRVMCFGGTKEFVDRVSAAEIRERYRLTPEGVTDEIARGL